MQNITIKMIDPAHEADIRIPNQPFALFGRMVPLYDGKTWSHKEELFATGSQMCFSDEGYRMEEMPDCTFLGAYEEETCVGLAVLEKSWSKFLYVYDLKVNANLRGRGIGGQLLAAAEKLAAEMGCCGLWVVAQDNNLAACRFYLKQGFAIGGLDTYVYRGTSQAGKVDIHFYKEFGDAT